MIPPKSERSPDHLTCITGDVCEVNTRRQEPATASHKRRDASLEALANFGKEWASLTCSGCQHRHVTACECPLRVFRHLPVDAHQTSTTLSIPDEAKRLPSGDQDTVSTQPWCPWQVCLGSSVFKSQSLTVVSPEPLASREASGENATQSTASVCPDKDDVHRVTGRTRNTASG
mmetsp:Transcript_45061/g.82463  ORF Transcript_45061/g.82463 Transcript_45061/m.82463 type:complete len:174 (-) Transcript_45061:406-927(-)